MRGAVSHTRHEKIVVSPHRSGSITGLMYNGSTGWSALRIDGSTSIGSVSQSYWPNMAVAYETSSGDALLVWNDNSQSNKLIYSQWNGNSWSKKTGVPGYPGARPFWMDIASKPCTSDDEIVLVVSDDLADDYAVIWYGTNWSNFVRINQSTSLDSDHDLSGISVAYESQSGHALVVYGHDGEQDNANYRIWDGSTWQGESSFRAPISRTRMKWTVLNSDPNSNCVVLSVHTSDSLGVWLGVWDGDDATWDTIDASGAGLTQKNIAPCASIAFESLSGEALAVYTVYNYGYLRYRTWTVANGWSSQQFSPYIGSNKSFGKNSVTLVADPLSNNIMLSVQDKGQAINMMLWDGNTNKWTSAGFSEVPGDDIKNQPFLFLYDQL